MPTAKFLADFDQFVASARTADATLEKLDVGGRQLASTLTNTQSNADRFRGSLQQFDGVMASLGVNIGAEVRALGELGAAAGKSAADLGLIATGGLAVGAAIGGWKIGRAISEFFDLDKAIGDATAKLLGWGDVAGEVAGANADLVGQLHQAETAMGFYRSNATKSADAIKAWHLELAAVTAAGDMESLTKDLESQNFPLKELAERYHVSVEALQMFGRETTAAAQAEKVAGDAIHASNDRKLKDLQTQMDATADFRGAMEELNSSGKGWQGTLDTIDGSVVAAIKSYLEAGVSQRALAQAYGLTDVQVKAVSSSLKDDQLATDREADALRALAEAQAIARTEAEAHTAELARQKKIMEDAAIAAAKLAAENRARGGSTQYDLSTSEGRSKVPDDIKMFLHDGYSFEQAARLSYAMKMGFSVDRDPLFAIKGPRVPGFAGGVHDYAGGLAMVGERGPELVNLPSGSDVIPFGRGGGGVTINNTFHIVDTEANIARRVANHLTRSILQGRKASV